MKALINYIHTLHNFLPKIVLVKLHNIYVDIFTFFASFIDISHLFLAYLEKSEEGWFADRL